MEMQVYMKRQKPQLFSGSSRLTHCVFKVTAHEQQYDNFSVVLYVTTLVVEPVCNFLVNVIHNSDAQCQQYFWKKFEEKWKFSFFDVQVDPVLKNTTSGSKQVRFCDKKTTSFTFLCLAAVPAVEKSSA